MPTALDSSQTKLPLPRSSLQAKFGHERGEGEIRKKNINDEIIDTWYLGQLPVTMHLSYTNLHASLGISAAADLGQEVRFLVYVSAHN